MLVLRIPGEARDDPGTGSVECEGRDSLTHPPTHLARAHRFGEPGTASP